MIAVVWMLINTYMLGHRVENRDELKEVASASCFFILDATSFKKYFSSEINLKCNLWNILFLSPSSLKAYPQ